MEPAVLRCVFCRSSMIHTHTLGRVVTVSCAECAAAFVVEFDPPDAPGVRGRIERMDEPSGADDTID